MDRTHFIMTWTTPLSEGELYYVSFAHENTPYLLATVKSELLGFSDRETMEELISDFEKVSRPGIRSRVTTRYTKAYKDEIEECVKKPLELVKFIWSNFKFYGLAVEPSKAKRVRDGIPTVML